MEPPRLARRCPPALLAALGLFACSGGESPTAPQAPAAATSTLPLVNSLADPGDGLCTAAQCTLREALFDPFRTEIAFAKGFGGTITLDPTIGPLVINGRFLSITGPTRGVVIRRAPGDPEFGIMNVQNGAHVRLANLTLTGGSALNGDGIEVDGSELSLVNVTVSGNSAVGTGGGIYVDASKVVIDRSTVRGNSSAVHGGGIYNGGQVTLTNSTVRDNTAASSGGGIYNISSDLTVLQSTIQGNEASGLDDAIEGGGGIYNIGTGAVAIALTTIAGNWAPEASGGGLLSINTLPQFPILSRNTISGNSAAVYGGGIYVNNSAALTLNSTLSGNSAVFGGGAWSTQDGILSLLNTTVAMNAASTGGGLGTLGGGELHLLNSLVARNTASSIEPDVSKAASTALFARFTLVGDGTGSEIADGVDGNKVGTGSAPLDPKIGKLANNGGSTRTHALLIGSPAIDAGGDTECQTTDQRGVTRPRGAHCDVGSYER